MREMEETSERSSAGELDDANADLDPIRQFQRWFDEADSAGLPMVEAMTLATATPEGRPSARMVLLKSVDERGFVFYTNYRSRKAQELEANPKAALVFHWEPLERQVRIEGSVSRISAAESDEYFQTRPRESQIGAVASPQSEVIESREVLEERFRQLENDYRDKPIERPPHWGGYRLEPDRIEFWKGRPGRLHDRLNYQREPNGTWVRTRLAP
jgi:pyridoxamine 5'-phosphate oxidase